MLHPNSPFYATHLHEAPEFGAGFDFLFNEYIIDDLNKLWISIAVMSGLFSELFIKESLPFTQYGQRICALLTWPHAEHRLSAVTSFNAFPAINRDLFFIYDVFFFGTARKSDSQRSPRRVGIFNWMAVGSESDRDGSNGRASCRILRLVVLEAKEAAEVENCGRKEERIADVVACAAAILRTIRVSAMNC